MSRKILSFFQLKEILDKKSAATSAAALNFNPALVYSPSQLPGKYHRRWRA